MNRDQTSTEIAARVKSHAKDIGFALCGIAPAARPDTFSALQDWLGQGFHGEMGYMQRREHAYEHPSHVLQSARSVIMVAATYPKDPSPNSHIAAYAQSLNDYHHVLRDKLRSLTSLLHDEFAGCKTRIVVDTAPLLERDFARTAGLGWFGKNTMLINKHIGSYFFLAAVLTNLELPPDPPHESAHCGTCTRCLEACPTDAFPEPGVLDARRCISYLTIELRDQPIPEEFHSHMGNWIFGCDICQAVCPWNRKAPNTHFPEFTPATLPEPADFVNMTEEEFQTRFANSPLARTGRENLARNATIALANTPNP